MFEGLWDGFEEGDPLRRCMRGFGAKPPKFFFATQASGDTFGVNNVAQFNKIGDNFVRK